jgi:hypothetical protein
LAAGALGNHWKLDAWIAPFARRRRSRIDAACPNCRDARDCTTRFFAGTACGASPVSVAASGALAQMLRVTASECSLGRVRRWHDEATLLRSCGRDGGDSPG